MVESYDGEVGGGGGVVDSPPGRHRARSGRYSATERREPALLVTQGRSEGGVSGKRARRVVSGGAGWGEGERHGTYLNDARRVEREASSESD